MVRFCNGSDYSHSYVQEPTLPKRNQYLRILVLFWKRSKKVPTIWNWIITNQPALDHSNCKQVWYSTHPLYLKAITKHHCVKIRVTQVIKLKILLAEILIFVHGDPKKVHSTLDENPLKEDVSKIGSGVQIASEYLSCYLDICDGIWILGWYLNGVWITQYLITRLLFPIQISN